MIIIFLTQRDLYQILFPAMKIKRCDSHRQVGHWTFGAHASGATNSLKRFIWGGDQTQAMVGGETKMLDNVGGNYERKTVEEIFHPICSETAKSSDVWHELLALR